VPEGAEKCVESLVVKSEGKKKLDVPGRKWEDSKGKTVPLQAWSGPEGSRKLRFPD
jgi:hypothetical protein